MAKPQESIFILTHGAGSDREAPLLVAVDEAFPAESYRVERINLAYRQRRPTGPPHPGDAVRDREEIRRAVGAARARTSGRVLLGGASYGGRQASIAAAEDPGLADGLLLLSYPLHPPGKPDRLRTAHLPDLVIPTLFVQGTRDPFGSIEEIRAAMKLVAGRTELVAIEGAGHDLKKGKGWPKDRLVSFFVPDQPADQ